MQKNREEDPEGERVAAVALLLLCADKVLLTSSMEDVVRAAEIRLAKGADFYASEARKLMATPDEFIKAWLAEWSLSESVQRSDDWGLKAQQIAEILQRMSREG